MRSGYCAAGAAREIGMKREANQRVFREKFPWLENYVRQAGQFSTDSISSEFLEEGVGWEFVSRKWNKMLFLDKDGGFITELAVGRGYFIKGRFWRCPFPFAVKFWNESPNDGLVRLGKRADDVKYILAIRPQDLGPKRVAVYTPRRAVSVASVWRQLKKKEEKSARAELRVELTAA